VFPKLLFAPDVLELELLVPSELANERVESGHVRWCAAADHGADLPL
jgi:hypothetical protein